MHPSFTVYKQKVFDFINRDFEIETLADDCLFTEGPVWNPEGYYLFSDITGNCIYRIKEGGRKELFISQSGTSNPDDPLIKKDQAGSNGLAYDADGHLLVCQHGSHAVAKWNGREIQPFLSSYDGKPFNSPNDLIVHSDGSIYFSDPPYGLKDGALNPGSFQPVGGVYCWKDGHIELISDKYQYPNGVCLSNDQRTLYICSNKPFEKFITTYELTAHRFTGIFAEENSDGIETDRYGNIYLCNKEGLIILDNKGERMAMIQLPAIPANACWGGDGLKDLLITAREHIFLFRGLQK
jgi:gluconolactonase